MFWSKKKDTDTLEKPHANIFGKPTATTADVHREFDTAVERIQTKANQEIEDAKNILNKEYLKDKDNIQRLKDMGFGKIKEVVDLTNNEQSLKNNNKILEHVKYARENYPNNKFISEGELTRICQKYGLANIKPKNYKGSIPLKNQKEITDFQLKDEDYCYFKYYDRRREREWPASYKDYQNQEARKQRDANYAATYVWDDSLVYKAMGLRVICTPDLVEPSRGEYYDTITGTVKLIDPDPVVLCQIQGGYVIVSKWGIEADMEEFN